MAEATPIDWAKRPLEKYADFSGRAPRAEYWWFTLAMVIASIVISIVENIVGLDGMFLTYGPLGLLLLLAVIVPSLAVTVRRLHDTNRRGWWILVAVIPYFILGIFASGAVASGSVGAMAGVGLFGLVAFAGAVVLLVLMVLPGTKGDNNYGPDPYAGGAAAAAA